MKWFVRLEREIQGYLLAVCSSDENTPFWSFIYARSSSENGPKVKVRSVSVDTLETGQHGVSEEDLKRGNE